MIELRDGKHHGQPAALRRFSSASAVFMMSVGVLVLLRWSIGYEWLKDLNFGLVVMNPMTAILFVLLGLALFWSLRPTSLESLRNARLLAGIVVIAAVMKLAGTLLGWHTGVDTWLFFSRLADTSSGYANRMAPNTAINMLLLGLGIFFLDTTILRGLRPSEYLAATAGFVALLALIGYAYGVGRMTGFDNYIPMALSSAITFLVAAIGMLSARSDTGWMAIVTGAGPGGAMARLMLPGLMLLVTVLGWLRYVGEKLTLVDTGIGITYYTLTIIVLGTLLTLRSARSLDHAAAKRVEAEKSIHALHAELVANAMQLEHSNQELEAFSYTVSHDLRAPLRHIDGYARMLQEDAADKLDGETRRYLDEISEAARRMGTLIDDLLAFSRLGRKPLQRIQIDMRALVKEALVGNGEVAEGTVHIGELPMAQADPTLLRQVWTNLLSNAIKYSSPRGTAARIDISGEQEATLVRYRIRDNGVGFDMNYADKLFGVFQRLHAEEEFEGTGVGLAIVKRIIARHGGTIIAQAEPGTGATFIFTLPATGPKDHAASNQVNSQ